MLICIIFLGASIAMLALMVKGYFDYLKFKDALKKWEEGAK